MDRKANSFLARGRGKSARLRAMQDAGLGKGGGLSIEVLQRVADVLAERGSTGNDAFREKSVRPTKGRLARIEAAAAAARRKAVRERKESVWAKHRAAKKAKYQWPDRIPERRGPAPGNLAGILEVPDGPFTRLDLPGGKRSLNRCRTPGWIVPVADGPDRFGAPGGVLKVYEITEEGRAARDFAWWCAALAALGYRVPIRGPDARYVAYWLRGEEPVLRQGVAGSDRGMWFGAPDELAWPGVGKWALRPLEGGQEAR